MSKLKGLLVKIIGTNNIKNIQYNNSVNDKINNNYKKYIKMC